MEAYAFYCCCFLIQLSVVETEFICSINELKINNTENISCVVKKMKDTKTYFYL